MPKTIIPQSQDLSTRMRSLISRFPESGQTVTQFCKSQNLSVAQYHYWRRKLGYYFRKTKKRGGFVKLDIKENYSAQVGLSGFIGYELQLPGGRILRIPFSFEADSLRSLLDILQD